MKKLKLKKLELPDPLNPEESKKITTPLDDGSDLEGGDDDGGFGDEGIEGGGEEGLDDDGTDDDGTDDEGTDDGDDDDNGDDDDDDGDDDDDDDDCNEGDDDDDDDDDDDNAQSAKTAKKATPKISAKNIIKVRDNNGECVECDPSNPDSSCYDPCVADPTSEGCNGDPCGVFTAMLNFLKTYSIAPGSVGSSSAAETADSMFSTFLDAITSILPSGTSYSFSTDYPPGSSSLDTNGGFVINNGDGTTSHATAVTPTTAGQTDFTIYLSPLAINNNGNPWALVGEEGHEMIHVWLTAEGYNLPLANEDYLAYTFQSQIWTAAGDSQMAQVYSDKAASLKTQQQDNGAWDTDEMGSLENTLPAVPSAVTYDPCSS